MDFNFLETYKDYSTAELLKIVQHPDDYQPAAVDAATQLLSKRQISEADVQQADEYVQIKEQEAKKRAEKSNDYKAKTGELFEPFTNPEKELPARWIHYLLALIVLQYLWVLYTAFKHFVEFFNCSYCELNFYSVILIVSLVYIPVVFYLIYKKRKSGWIVLFAINLFGLIMLLIPFVNIIYRFAISTGTLITIVGPLLIKAAVTAFLWRKAVVRYFNVTEEARNRTALLTGIVTAIFLLYAYFGFLRF